MGDAERFRGISDDGDIFKNNFWRCSAVTGILIRFGITILLSNDNM